MDFSGDNGKTSHNKYERGDISLDDGDLAELVRRSWSEPQEAGNDNLSYSYDSPISTALDSMDIKTFNSNRETVSENVEIQTDVPSLQISSNYRNVSDENTNHSGGLNNSHEYQLFKRHYNMADGNPDTITNILDDLQLDSQSNKGTIHLMKQNQPLNPPINVDVSAASSTLNARRGSIEEVQWVRQLLNPRSSFSGITQTADNSDAIDKNKVWVTIIDCNTAIDIVKSIVVLNQSLKQVNSRFELIVLNLIPKNENAKNASLDLNFLKRLDIRIVDVETHIINLLAIDGVNINPNIAKLALFLQFVDKDYELICYLSPTLMVTQNIDELLSSEEICNEIDNETCVLLTNNNSDLKVDTSTFSENNSDENELDIIIIRPISEVGMCIKEYFTIYGNDMGIKHRKLTELTNHEVLKQLFGDSWARLSSQGYLQHLSSYLTIDDIKCKILDYKKLQPWSIDDNTRTNILHNPLYGHWYHTWYNSMKR